MKIELRDKVFAAIGRFISKYWMIVLITALGLTILAGSWTEKLNMEMSWLSIAPQKAFSVRQFNKIIKEFDDANPIIVAIKGDNFEKMKSIAEDMVKDFKNMKEDIKDVNYKLDITFIKKYGLLLQKAKDLKRMQSLMKDFNLSEFFKNLNDDFEKEYIEESEESLAKQEKSAVQSLDSLNDILHAYRSYLTDPVKGEKELKNAVNKFSTGEEYFLSRDKTMLLIFLQPYVPITDINKIIPVVKKTEKILDKYRGQYRAMQFGQTGMSVISRDEMETSMSDTKTNLITALIAIFLLLAISFRMYAAPFLGIISLLIGITWDLGITYFFVGRLNIMTAMVSVVLIGLGIDYAIHIISGYTQSRFQGMEMKDAWIVTYQKTGPGILTGALTTAVAFLVFMVSEIEMMQELGFVMGMGIICTFIAALFILPAMIVAKEKLQRLFKMKRFHKSISMEYMFLSKMGEKVIKKSSAVLVVLVLITIFFIILIPRIHFVSDIKKIEAEGLTSLELMDEINEKFDISPDPVHIIAGNLKEVSEKKAMLEKYSSVGLVDSIANYLPSSEEQARRLPYLNKIKSILNTQPSLHTVNKEKLIKELKRLEMNIIEIGDMAVLSGLDKLVKRRNEMVNWKVNKKTGKNIIDKLVDSIKKVDLSLLNKMQLITASLLKSNFEQMCYAHRITMKDIPQNIKNLYISRDKKSYLINVYSSKNIWEDMLHNPFLEDVQEVDKKITGAAVFMYDVIRYSAKGGKQATILAFIAVFLLLLMDFKNLKFTFISLIPLVLGSIWILGFLVLSGIYFTWMTVMIVPLIIGIGIDDGVHIIHRYRIEGRNSIPLVLRTTGKAVLLTSLTTMIGFGSLVFSKMVGYQHFGLSLFIGIGLLFIFSTVLLPVVLSLFEKK